MKINKRGQAGAAVLLAIIIGLIILFILTISPEERSELLGEETTSNTNRDSSDQTSTSVREKVKETLLQENPGRISYLKEDESDELISPVHIFTQTQSGILEQRDSLLITKGLFSSQEQELYFELEDLDNTKNIYLDFSIEEYSGNLIITLNGKEIFNRKTNKIQPIKLTNNLLEEENFLLFQVSSPGAAFWAKNNYQLKNVKVVADITDISARESRQLFHIDEDKIRNIEESTLRFSVSCIPEQRGQLDVKINNHVVYSGVPENCEDILYYNLPPEIIEEGNNYISFKTDEGDYQFSHIAIHLKMEEPSYPVFYFELDDDYFTVSSEDNALCGELDGLCPNNCDEDADQDCCFQEYSEPYWCDAPTSNSDDRCVDYVEAEDCDRCLSGYEDDSGNPSEQCEELCGDDTDNNCPSDCSANHDKDCCFDRSGEQYWCDDLPINGIDFSCVDSLSVDECSLCPTPGNYEGESTDPNCIDRNRDDDDENELQRDYDLILTLEFADEEKKDADLYINGHKISFDTYKIEFSRNIENYAEPWTNSIKIIPQNSFDIKELKIELKN